MKGITLKDIVGWVGGPTAILAIMWAFLVYLDGVPVVQRDFIALAGEVKENSEDRLRDDLRELRIQRSKNDRDIRELQDDHQPVPDWLLIEKTDLELEIEQIQQKLEELDK